MSQTLRAGEGNPSRKKPTVDELVGATVAIRFDNFHPQTVSNAMPTTDRSGGDSSKTGFKLKKDASNFDDYMLAVGLTALVGILVL